MKYKIQLNEHEINTIQHITNNKKKQQRLMSVLTYIKKYSDDEGQLTRSLRELHKMYIRLIYRRISLSYFYDLVTLLKDNGLFNAQTTHKITHTPEQLQSTDIQQLEKVNAKHNDLINNKYNTNTLEIAEVKILVDEILKDLKVKSEVIKQMVMSKLVKVKLDSAGAVSYILKVVMEKVEQYAASKTKYTHKVAQTRKKRDSINYAKKQSKFCGYAGQRTTYADIEAQLLALYQN